MDIDLWINDNNNKKELKNNNNRDNQVLDFKVTENISNIGILEFAIYRYESEHIIVFKFNNNNICYIPFLPRKISMTNLLKEIKKKLLKIRDIKDNYKDFTLAFNEIENHIIENRNKIFFVSFDTYHNNIKSEDSKAQFNEDIDKLRNQWIESPLTYEQWQSKVYEKYEKLRQVIQKYYPEAWTFMEFCLSVKSILNIQDCTLPFMGVLIAPPSSMKTMIIQLFRKYPNTFYTDSFTPSSLISHISTKTEEELQKVDMIPKMKDKVVLTPELAPIFTSKEDDLQKVMGILTRLLDGHGLENDSGTHGHRKYGDTMFVWLGAVVEIPPRVWKILGTLGHKIYFKTKYAKKDN